jgi:hypothetical protein
VVLVADGRIARVGGDSRREQCWCIRDPVSGVERLHDGITGADLADDPRVASRLDAGWDTTLRSGFDRYREAGSTTSWLPSRHSAMRADLLAGTDTSVPLPFLGRLAHGASLHHELQYLVRAGLTPSRLCVRPPPPPPAASASMTADASTRA